MAESVYRQEQMARIDAVLRKADQAKEICNELRALSGKGDAPAADRKDFTEDVLRIFDTSNSQGQIARLEMRIRELKQTLIEIKLENDRLLLEGGYVSEIDKTISDIFLANTLCRLQAKDPHVREVMDDVKEKLTTLKTDLA